MLQCALYNIQILTSYAYCYNCLNAYVYIHTHFKMEEFALYNKDVGVYEFQFSFSYSKISRSKKIKILELMLEQKKKTYKISAVKGNDPLIRGAQKPHLLR